jgi:hypothetical protein
MISHVAHVTSLPHEPSQMQPPAIAFLVRESIVHMIAMYLEPGDALA